MTNKTQNQERQNELETLSIQLHEGIKNYIQSDRYRELLDALARFHQYSFNNSILITLQKPNATQVASYTTWKSLNRSVNKGEHGIAIYAPVKYWSYEEIKKIDPDTERPLLNEDGKEIIIRKKVERIRYKLAYVFDISQTHQIEGKKEYPLAPTKELSKNFESYNDLSKAIQDISPVSIKFDNIRSGAKGYYSDFERKIVIQANMSDSQTLKTMIHELAHAILHGTSNVNSKKDTLRFYVAECMEFPGRIGEYFENLTLKEAMELYDWIPSQRLNAGKGIGCMLYENGELKGMLPILERDQIQIDSINLVKQFSESLEVQKAIMTLKGHYEDDGVKLRSTKEVQAESIAYIVCNHYGLDTGDYSFGYVGTWMENEKQLLENMNAIKACSSEIIDKIDSSLNRQILEKNNIHTYIDMTKQIDNFMKNFDLYEYKDQELYKGSNYDQTLTSLRNGKTQSIETALLEIIKDEKDDQIINEAKELLKCVKTFQKKDLDFPKPSKSRGIKR